MKPSRRWHTSRRQHFKDLFKRVAAATGALWFAGRHTASSAAPACPPRRVYFGEMGPVVTFVYDSRGTFIRKIEPDPNVVRLPPTKPDSAEPRSAEPPSSAP